MNTDAVIESGMLAGSTIATVIVDGLEPVTVRALWSVPELSTAPAGAPLQRQDQLLRLSFLRRDVPALPRGTIIEAPAPTGGPVVRWSVDLVETLTASTIRAVVVCMKPQAAS